jgi:hypothetical protein
MTQFDICLREPIFFQKGRGGGGGGGGRFLFLFWLFPRDCSQFPKWHSSSQCVPQEIPCSGGVLSLAPLLYFFSSLLTHHILWNFSPSPPLCLPQRRRKRYKMEGHIDGCLQTQIKFEMAWEKYHWKLKS